MISPSLSNTALFVVWFIFMSSSNYTVLSSLTCSVSSGILSIEFDSLAWERIFNTHSVSNEISV